MSTTKNQTNLEERESFFAKNLNISYRLDCKKFIVYIKIHENT